MISFFVFVRQISFAIMASVLFNQSAFAITFDIEWYGTVDSLRDISHIPDWDKTLDASIGDIIKGNLHIVDMEGDLDPSSSRNYYLVGPEPRTNDIFEFNFENITQNYVGASRCSDASVCAVEIINGLSDAFSVFNFGGGSGSVWPSLTVEGGTKDLFPNGRLPIGFMDLTGVNALFTVGDQVKEFRGTLQSLRVVQSYSEKVIPTPISDSFYLFAMALTLLGMLKHWRKMAA